MCETNPSELETEVAELRAQLSRSSVLELEELKRTLERKEKERLQLSVQLKVRHRNCSGKEFHASFLGFEIYCSIKFMSRYIL